MWGVGGLGEVAGSGLGLEDGIQAPVVSIHINQYVC